MGCVERTRRPLNLEVPAVDIGFRLAANRSLMSTDRVRPNRLLSSVPRALTCYSGTMNAIPSNIRPRRTFLFVPGDKLDMFPKAVAAGPDIVCVDLEDAIAPAHKESARRDTVELFAGSSLAESGGPELLVRINSPRSPDGIADLHTIFSSDTPLPGLMLPKVKSADEIRLLDELFESAGYDTRFQVIIETNEGLEACREIAQASGRIDALLFGAIDMAAELRVDHTWSALLYARSRVVHAAATAGIDVIDVPFLELDNMEGLAEAARKARDLGMTGKGAIHPKQLEIITQTFTPSPEEVAEARRIVDAFEAHDRGLLVMNGRLVEKPVIVRMQRILANAAR